MTYLACKAIAYPLLATIASCDHQKAVSKGYVNGWQMLLDKHDDNEMAFFCMNLNRTLTLEQSTILLDGLAQEFTEFSNWLDFTDACTKYPGWKPSRETVAEYAAKPAFK